MLFVCWSIHYRLQKDLDDYFRNVSHDTDFQEIRQVEASTRFKEPSIMDEEQMGSFSRRSEESDDLSDLLGSKKVWLDGSLSKMNTLSFLSSCKSAHILILCFNLNFQTLFTILFFFIWISVLVKKIHY